jgi:subtilisin-like proprotein convertase family protein
VSDITLETLTALMIYCSDSTPLDGWWSCVWDASTANGGIAPPDGTRFDLRLRASDGNGAQSAWTDWRTFIVDAISPVASFSPETTLAFSGTVVSASTIKFTGVVTDNHGLSSVDVCLNGVCGSANLQSETQSLYTYDDVSDIAINASTTCAGGEIVRTFTVTESFTIGSVSLGFNAGHERRNDILALLGSPSGTWVQVLGPKIGSPYDAWNYDVLLSDAFGIGLHDDRGDDNLLPAYFDRHARPDDPLRLFQGETSAGVWTLKICDANPLEKDGVYHRSRLLLKPANTAALTGAWSYSVSGLGNLDSVAQTLEVYATDLAGNRSLEPIRLDFFLDNVAPQITATQLVTQTVNTGPRIGIRVLEGAASDGGSIAQMYALVKTPQGNLGTMQVSMGAGTDWWFNLFPEELGNYDIWIYGVDEGGNTTGVGRFSVLVTQAPLGDHQIYCPIIIQPQPLNFKLYLAVLQLE